MNPVQQFLHEAADHLESHPKLIGCCTALDDVWGRQEAESRYNPGTWASASANFCQMFQTNDDAYWMGKLTEENRHVRAMALRLAAESYDD